MAITKLILNGVEYDIGNLVVTEGPQLYEGREISEYTWAQLKTKIQNADYDDIRVGDYKTITLSDGEVVQPQIAGIDTYTGVGDISLGHHIDWISKDCLKETVRWNLTNNNNGTAEESCPYLASNIKSYLINTVYPKLPNDVKSVISDKKTLLEERYSSNGVLIESTQAQHRYIGHLWLPSEYEVFGSVIWGTNVWSTGTSIQYPLFVNSGKHRVKRNRTLNTLGYWWTSTVIKNGHKEACRITGLGHPAIANTDNLQAVTIGFRIA